jgi:integrase
MRRRKSENWPANANLPFILPFIFPGLMGAAMGRKAHPYRIKEQDGYWYYKLREDRAFHSTGIPSANPKTTRRRAERFAEKKLAIAPAARSAETLADYAALYFADDSCPWYSRKHGQGKNVTRHTRDQHRNRLDAHIIPQFGGHRFDELSPIAIESWLYDLDYSSQWKKHIYNTFKIILRDMRRDGLITFSPADIDPPTVRNSETATISDEHAARLFPATVREFRATWGRSYPLGVLLAVLYSGGLRTSEARALSWGAIDWKNRGAMIIRTVDKDGNLSPPKGKSVRVVPLPSHTLELVRGLPSHKHRSDRDRLVFPGRTLDDPRAPLDIGAPAHALRRKLEDLDIPADVTPHGLRHTYNTRMREILASVGLDGQYSDNHGFLSTTAEVDQLLRSFTGHKSARMTELYDHPKLINRLKFLDQNFRDHIEKIWHIHKTDHEEDTNVEGN